jgi:hypothetical protein
MHFSPNMYSIIFLLSCNVILLNIDFIFIVLDCVHVYFTRQFTFSYEYNVCVMNSIFHHKGQKWSFSFVEFIFIVLDCVYGI